MIFSQSIRWRLQLWHTLLLAVIVTTLLYAFHRSQRKITYEILDRELTGPITDLLPRFDGGGRGKPSGRRPPPDRKNLDLLLLDELSTEAGRERPGRPGGPGGPGGPGNRRPPGGPEGSPPSDRIDVEKIEEYAAELAALNIYIISWGRPRDNTLYQSANLPDPAPPRPSPSSIGYSARTRDGYREIIHQSPGGRIILSGTSLKPYEENLASLRNRLIAIGFAIIALGFIVGWLLVSRSLRPIKSISKTAHRIAQGNLSRRIHIREPESELGQVSKVLNDTFEKLETSFEHQVRFTADASHEMRTPVAVILAKSQFALARDRSPKKYQEALQTCLDSAQHMRALINSLLDLSRIDSGEFNLHKEEGDLSLLAREITELIRPLAEERQVTLVSNLQQAPLCFDPQRMRQAILNLLSNAVKYNRRDGQITITLTQDAQETTLSIQDTGPGIARENIPHLFERFYRIDRARTRGKDGSTGLGLAITQAIIKAHGGTIEVDSTLDVGTTFTIKL